MRFGRFFHADPLPDLIGCTANGVVFAVNVFSGKVHTFHWLGYGRGPVKLHRRVHRPPSPALLEKLTEMKETKDTRHSVRP